MNALALLSHFKSRGVVLYLADGMLRYRSSPGAYTPDLRLEVASRRDELIKVLAGDSNTWPYDLATWVRGLELSSLPVTPFRLNPWSTVTDPARFLAWIKAAAGRYAERPGDATAIKAAESLMGLVAWAERQPHESATTP